MGLEQAGPGVEYARFNAGVTLRWTSRASQPGRGRGNQRVISYVVGHVGSSSGFTRTFSFFVSFRKEREFNETRFVGNDEMEVQLPDVRGETG